MEIDLSKQIQIASGAKTSQKDDEIPRDVQELSEEVRQEVEQRFSYRDKAPGIPGRRAGSREDEKGMGSSQQRRRRR